jgi:16S rRNA (guanine966-N2)-methyltransferase
LSVKILGGFARGQVLQIPKGILIRPTSVLLKRRIFDFYQDFSEIIFVDICAGSGAMGLEAWSRGAVQVYLNEINRHVLPTLEENRESLLVKNNHKKTGTIICKAMDAIKFLHIFRSDYLKLNKDQQENSVIFLDPPYAEKKIYKEIIEYLYDEQWFQGQLWIESDNQKGFKSEHWIDRKLTPVKLFEQGDSYIFVTNFPQIEIM